MSVLKLQFRDLSAEVMSRMQDNLASGIDALDTPIVSGVLVSRVAVTASPALTLVSHGLGRVPLSFVTLAPSANATVWEGGVRTTTQLTLTASAAVTVDLWVF